MKTVKIYTQHEENKKWMNNLLFYKDEIKVLDNRLSEVAGKNSTKEVLSLVEHFQNQLKIQNNTIDELKHDLNVSNDTINHEINKNKTAVDHRDMEDDVVLKDKLTVFEKTFNNNKTSLNLFLAKWM